MRPVSLEWVNPDNQQLSVLCRCVDSKEKPPLAFGNRGGFSFIESFLDVLVYMTIIDSYVIRTNRNA